jgi:archaellum biogenesis protein FlaJ (TadC family)
MANISPYANNIKGKIEELESKPGNKEVIKQLDMLLTDLYSEITVRKDPSTKSIPVVKTEKGKEIASPELDSKKFKNLSDAKRKSYIEELHVNKDQLERFIKEEKKKQEVVLKKEDYSVYAPNDLGRTANKFAKVHADRLIEKYPKLFEPLFQSFEAVSLPFFSRTYVSLMLFFSVLSIPVFGILFAIFNIAFGLSWFLVIPLMMVAPVATFAGMYYYPKSLEGDKEKKIRLELPFALVHMSAVAGSGAHPISMFEMLVKSEEYPVLKKEITKIMNQVNLYGYNLTTALKNVSETTPSKELKELLNGIISTVETGGDLNDYLKEKAAEALNSYKLYRKKKVEALGTYSEIYTAILIAAPLLLVVTLAIMNVAGGFLGGISVSTLGWIAIGGVLPVMNIAFMAFLSSAQK